MFNIRTGQQAHISVGDAAAQRDLYSMPEIDGTVDHVTLEHRFSTEIETPVAPILRSVINRSSIDQSEKEILCKFVYTFYSRVPSRYGRLKAQAPRLAKQVLRNAIARIDPSLSDEQRNEMIRLGNEVTEFQAKNPPKEAMLPLGHGRAVPHLMKMRFVFVTVATGFQFVTGDSPLAFENKVGLSKSDFTLPVCSDMALIGTHNRAVRDLTYHQVSASVGREINFRTVQNASRFVYSRSKLDWLNHRSDPTQSIRRTMWP